MQQFPCPFCGLRDEREFHFAAEAGKKRPDTSVEVSQTDWSQYLNSYKNRRGKASEVWVHLPCQEYFIMHRDTLSMKVLGTEQLRRQEEI